MKRPVQTTTTKSVPAKKSTRDVVVLSNDTLKMVNGGQGVIITAPRRCP